MTEQFFCFGLLVFMVCQPPEETVVDSYCQRACIIQPSRQDTDGTLRIIEIQNEKARRICGGELPVCPGGNVEVLR